MATNGNPLTDHLDLWTSALLNKSSAGRGGKGKPEAYGIKKLRELILELAVRGKLVPQDPNDERAEVLLRKIAKERDHLAKEGILKKPNKLPAIIDNEKPYTLPNGWEWVRLGQIINISSGDGLTSSEMTKSGKIPVYGGNGVTGYHDKANVDKPTLVIGRVGYYCGSIHITPTFAWVTDNAFVTAFSEDNICLDFLAWLLKGTNLKENENATAQPVISGRKVYPIVVGLPPLNEQYRIVAKVDELMALCDRLEQQQADSQEAHQTLIETLLGTLTQTPARVEPVEARLSTSTDRTEFEEAWILIADHFDILFTTEYSIDQLKQTILQLAVMGKLVKQEGAWTQTCLGSLGEWAVGSGFPKSEQGRENLEILFSKVSDMNLAENTKFIVTTNHTISEHTSKKLGVNVHTPGTVIFPKIGGAIATNKRRILTRPTAIDNNCLGITPKRDVSTEWLFLVLSSIDFVKYQAGTSVPALSQGTLAKIPVWLPGFPEQHRIVAKVDELMALCDTLKAQLKAAQTTQINLADAIVELAAA